MQSINIHGVTKLEIDKEVRSDSNARSIRVYTGESVLDSIDITLFGENESSLLLEGETPKTLTKNGKKYQLVEEEDSDNIPF